MKIGRETVEKQQHIHRLQEIGWLWIITGGSLASAVALEINSRLCLAKYIKRQR